MDEKNSTEKFDLKWISCRAIAPEEECDPPLDHLFVQGSFEPELWRKRGLCVVGTRYPEKAAQHLVDRVLESLSGQNFVILSGMAKGIDASAHESAIRYGLKTVGILGGGHWLNYPRETLHLRDKMLKNGGSLLSEYEPHTDAKPYQFLRRNRLLAYFSKAVWMVQAREKSGAMNTAWWAQQMHRDLYVTPSFPTHPAYSGNLKLHLENSCYGLWDVRSLESTWSDLSISLVRREKISAPEKSA